MEANGLLIRRKREGLGHGLNRFAANIGLNNSTLSRIETGQRKPRPETLKKIADGLGCKITDLASHDVAQGGGAEFNLQADSTPPQDAPSSTSNHQ